MIEQIIPFVGLLVGIVLLVKLNPRNIDTFLRAEAKRGLQENFKISDKWHSEGRVYTEGLTLIEDKKGRIAFVRQAKLADTGLLH
ncbi:MAG: hypothetical protein Q9M36_11330 [Sulfurovum sp.]|nr:hypothetical protein [Sulfurovum sp.]